MTGAGAANTPSRIAGAMLVATWFVTRWLLVDTYVIDGREFGATGVFFATVGGLTMVSRVLGFVRDILIAAGIGGVIAAGVAGARPR